MAEYIERDAVCSDCKNQKVCVDKSVCPVGRAPAADVKVVKRGRWERLPDNEEWAYCSQCHCCWELEIINNCNVRYCPNCGCKMDLEVTNGLDQH